MSHSIVAEIFRIARPVSIAVKPRSAAKVYLHLLSELGELAEEVNIAAGELYKQPGPDGITGEAADVMNCIADLLWIVEEDKDVLDEACAEIAHLADLDDFDTRQDWPSFTEAKDDFTGTTTNVHIPYALTEGTETLCRGHVRMILSEMVRFTLTLARAADPDLTQDSFLEIFTAKCAKWREKAS